MENTIAPYEGRGFTNSRFMIQELILPQMLNEFDLATVLT